MQYHTTIRRGLTHSAILVAPKSYMVVTARSEKDKAITLHSAITLQTTSPVSIGHYTTNCNFLES